MDPITLGLLIAAAVTAIVTIVTLTVARIAEWFRAKKSISTDQKDSIGILIAERIRDKQFVQIPGVFSKATEDVRVVQAIYNTSTGEVAIKSKDLEVELRSQIEAGDGMIVYT